MSTEIGSYEAKTHLSALLERVVRGERFVITRHGKPIARLVPVGSVGPGDRREAIQQLKAAREGRTLGIPVKKLIEQGRR
jgi:prevent-host-death family protein